MNPSRSGDAVALIDGAATRWRLAGREAAGDTANVTARQHVDQLEQDGESPPKCLRLRSVEAQPRSSDSAPTILPTLGLAHAMPTKAPRKRGAMIKRDDHVSARASGQRRDGFSAIAPENWIVGKLPNMA